MSRATGLGRTTRIHRETSRQAREPLTGTEKKVDYFRYVTQPKQLVDERQLPVRPSMLPSTKVRDGVRRRRPQEPLVRQEARDADRAARVDAAGRDAQLRAQAEPKPVGEARRRVVEDVRAVDLAQEALRDLRIFGDDAVRVARRVAVHVGHGGVDTSDVSTRHVKHPLVPLGFTSGGRRGPPKRAASLVIPPPLTSTQALAQAASSWNNNVSIAHAAGYSHLLMEPRY